MRLEIASRKAIEYACKNFHYAKSVPNVSLAFNVFNQKKEWCGTICYGVGATNNIASPYGLKQGQVIELLRMALNGKQESTSKALALSLKIIPKKAPNVKIIVSYADSEQGHLGIIYQATNWFYTGYSVDSNLAVNGKREHRRTLGSRFGTCSSSKIKKLGYRVEIIKTKPKYKYIYPLTLDMKELCEKLKKPYPKKSVKSIDSDATPSQEEKAVQI